LSKLRRNLGKIEAKLQIWAKVIIDLGKFDQILAKSNLASRKLLLVTCVNMLYANRTALAADLHSALNCS